MQPSLSNNLTGNVSICEFIRFIGEKNQIFPSIRAYAAFLILDGNVPWFNKYFCIPSDLKSWYSTSNLHPIAIVYIQGWDIKIM